MTASSELVAKLKTIVLMMRDVPGFTEVADTTDEAAEHILALEADKAALVEALEYVISDFELPLMALDAIGSTLAKHGGS